MLRKFLSAASLVLLISALMFQVGETTGAAQSSNCLPSSVSGACVFYIASDIVNGVDVSPDGSVVAATGRNSFAVLLDASDGSIMARMPESASYSVKFSPDGNMLALGQKGHVTLRNASDGSIIRTLEGAEDGGEFASVVFSPDGTLLAAGAVGYIHLWRVADGVELTRELNSQFSLGGLPEYHGTQVEFSPDGTALGVAGFAGGSLWSVTEEGLQDEIRFNSRFGFDLGFSPDGSRLAFGYEHTVEVWDLSEGVADVQFFEYAPGVNNFVSAIKFKSNSRELITGHHRGIKIRDVVSGELTYQNNAVQSGNGRVERFIALSPDEKGAYVATEMGGGTAGMVLIYEVR